MTPYPRKTSRFRHDVPSHSKLIRELTGLGALLSSDLNNRVDGEEDAARPIRECPFNNVARRT